MKGWRALTYGWERPVQPGPEVTYGQKPRRRREGIVPDEVRKVVSDLDAISLTAQKEIRRVLAEHGLDQTQQVQLVHRIRRARG